MSVEARLHPSLRDEPLFAVHLFPVDFGSRTAKVERLARRLAASAVERDRAGGSPQAERELLRDSGLLTLAVPQQYGGQGVAWPEIYRITRYLAAVDSSLAHLFAFQHLQVATLLLFGNLRPRQPTRPREKASTSLSPCPTWPGRVFPHLIHSAFPRFCARRLVTRSRPALLLKTRAN